MRFCAGADLLVHDAEYTPEEYSTRFTGWGHSSYTSALRLAEAELNPERFIAENIAEIRTAVGDGLAINALSGGVDSSVVTMLGHRALGSRLRTVFVDNGIMREGEPETRGRACFAASVSRSKSSTPKPSFSPP